MQSRALPLVRSLTSLTVAGLALTLVGGVPDASARPGRDHAQEAFAATNAERAAHGRPRLRRQACLQRQAEHQAARLARRQEVLHQDLRDVRRDCGLRAAGENVASGYESGASVVDQGWMHSQSHRRNLLDRRFRLLGLASRRSEDGTFYTVQVFGVR